MCQRDAIAGYSTGAEVLSGTLKVRSHLGDEWFRRCETHTVGCSHPDCAIADYSAGYSTGAEILSGTLKVRSHLRGGDRRSQNASRNGIHPLFPLIRCTQNPILLGEANIHLS
ncbi:MAG: hypothetical protein AB1861_18960 [Cyanobacteriota bacterium]